MAIIPLPDSCWCVAESEWWPEPLVAISGGLLTLEDIVTDRGDRWRAQYQLELRPGCCMGTLERFIQRLRGGVNTVLLFDANYDAHGPWGTGRSFYEEIVRRTGAPPDPVEWEGEITWANGAAWAAQPGLIVNGAVAQGAISLSVGNGFPGAHTICPNDVLTIAGQTYLVLEASVTSALGLIAVTLETGLAAALAGGEAVTVGGRIYREMRLTSREAGRNRSDRDGVARYTLDFIEARYA